MIIMVGNNYKNSSGQIWKCHARGIDENKERFALLHNKNEVVWLAMEYDWKLLTKTKEKFKK